MCDRDIYSALRYHFQPHLKSPHHITSHKIIIKLNHGRSKPSTWKSSIGLDPGRRISQRLSLSTRRSLTTNHGYSRRIAILTITTVLLNTTINTLRRQYPHILQSNAIAMVPRYTLKSTTSIRSVPSASDILSTRTTIANLPTSASVSAFNALAVPARQQFWL